MRRMGSRFTAEERHRQERMIALVRLINESMVLRIKAQPPRSLAALFRWYDEELRIRRFQHRPTDNPACYLRGGKI